MNYLKKLWNRYDDRDHYHYCGMIKHISHSWWMKNSLWRFKLTYSFDKEVIELCLLNYASDNIANSVKSINKRRKKYINHIWKESSGTERLFIVKIMKKYGINYKELI